MVRLEDIVLVVEGTSDIAFLNSFLETEIVSTNGSAVPRETIQYLKAIEKRKQIVILTDPDAPGKRIRQILEQELEEPLHCYLNKEDCIKNGKVGVAESTKEAVLMALEHVPTSKGNESGNWTSSDLMNLKLIGNEDASLKRKYIGRKFHLGYGNGKLLLKRFNSLNISYDDVAAALKEYENEGSK